MNNILNKVKGLIDLFFDILFSILSFTTVLFAIVNFWHFVIETYHNWFVLENLFEVWLLTLISVKFYVVLKDYIWDHHIEINNLVEIGLVAFLSELIFKLETYNQNEIIIRIVILIILMIFFLIEKKEIEKALKK